ncbi:benzoate transporter [Hahella sp. CCB-MM4]|uniref:glycosyltransferase family 2 protein n=1 Tax=Hahella sp. (strain CCB-MM4) TaxID=1926491 RepID=UPI000B9A635B|nr:glycosyltransferase family 2 protein [Hahella sp. CCB-MM4]OZG74921.1 benzoate transporter [Hahella sp. CCB-MM4]
MPKISVTIITLNEAKHIEACIRSVSFADEVLVIDSGSTDGTVSIAEAAGAKVIKEAWRGFGAQKQFAVEQATNDWVFCLDADERPSPELTSEIISTMQNPAYHAYSMPRCNTFLGRWLRYGEGYPDLSLRMFDRRHARWSEDVVHEKVETAVSVGVLKSDLMHFSEDGIQAYLTKQNRYTSLQAEQMLAKGKIFSVSRMIFSPFFRFLKFYIVRRGFRDGVPGLIHILIGCMNSFNKYAKLYELQVKSNKAKEVNQ